MAISFNILTDAPTLTYPNGGETFAEGSMNIQWTEPTGIPSTELVWYEIFITDSFDFAERPKLLQIATIPSGNSFYSYYIDKNLKGEKCRVGIRAVNHQGLRSHISYSAANFTIINVRLPSPAVMEPLSNNTYFSYIPVLFDQNSVMGRCSQRAFYQIYYKSEDQDIDWTLLRGNIMVGSDPFSIDVSDFAISSDYAFKIELVDGDNVSAPLFIEDVTINNVNYFLIDTVPPKGFIKMIDNQEYTRETGVLLNLSAYDETTGVKEFRIEQINLDSDETTTPGVFSSMASFATWDIQGSDGGKLIQAKYKDYGDNIIQKDDKKYFRTYKNIDDREVTAMLYSGSDLYIAFAEGQNPSASSVTPSPKLYKNQSLLFTLDGDATALGVYSDALYIAIKDNDNKGVLQRTSLSGGEVESVANNTNQFLDAAMTTLNSLYAADSIINTMEVFDNTLFMGLQNGKLLSFTGSTVSTEYEAYLNVRSIHKLTTDGNLLYIFFSDSDEVITMRKTVGGNYVFAVIDTGN